MQDYYISTLSIIHSRREIGISLAANSPPCIQSSRLYLQVLLQGEG